MKKSLAWKFWVFFVVMVGAAGTQAAEFNFSSTTDFIRMECLLKDINAPRPDALTLNVTLSPEATERMQQVMRDSIGQRLTFAINGRKITTSTVHEVIGPQFRMSIPRAVAKDLLPTLID